MLRGLGMSQSLYNKGILFILTVPVTSPQRLLIAWISIQWPGALLRALCARAHFILLTTVEGTSCSQLKDEEMAVWGG